MIVESHPVLQLLRSPECQWDCHLVGSRYVGVFTPQSDYDFLMLVPTHQRLTAIDWLRASGFAVTSSYGPDKRSTIYRRDEPGFPPVDVIVVSPGEGARRLRFFAQLRDEGNKRGGLFAKAMKSERAWGTLWSVLDGFEAVTEAG